MKTSLFRMDNTVTRRPWSPLADRRTGFVFAEPGRSERRQRPMRYVFLLELCSRWLTVVRRPVVQARSMTSVVKGVSALVSASSESKLAKVLRHRPCRRAAVSSRERPHSTAASATCSELSPGRERVRSRCPCSSPSPDAGHEDSTRTDFVTRATVRGRELTSLLASVRTLGNKLTEIVPESIELDLCVDSTSRECMRNSRTATTSMLHAREHRPRVKRGTVLVIAPIGRRPKR